GSLGMELVRWLNRKNGFYAFESALHVFPMGGKEGVLDLAQWNRDRLWRKDYGTLTQGCLFFAEDVFGCQFCIREEAVYFFDPETGEAREIARSLQEWAGLILDDYEVQTGFPIAHRWQEQHGPLPPGMRLVAKIPFVCGGTYEISNLALMDSVQAMRCRANLARQIHSLPDGTKIRFRITD